MKNITLLITVCFFLSGVRLASAQYNGTSFNIKDENFFNGLMSNGLDLDFNGQVDYHEAVGIADLFLSGLGISDLTGLEYFTDLIFLQVDNNNLTNIDLTGTNVGILHCQDNNIDSINFGGLTYFQELNCQNNAFEELDLTQFGDLIILKTQGNPLLSRVCVNDVSHAESKEVLGSFNKDASSTWSDCLVSSKELGNSGGIVIFPNPTSELITVSEKFDSYKIFDLSGAVVSYGKYSKKINLSSLSKGSYMISLAFENGQIINKSFIKE